MLPRILFLICIFKLVRVHGITNVSVPCSDTRIIYGDIIGRWFDPNSDNSNLYCPGVLITFTVVSTAYATLFFTGVAIYFIGSTDPSGGLIPVILDGNVTTVDRLSSTRLCNQLLFEQTGLSDTLHNITITLTGASSNAENGPALTLQSFVYTVPDSTSSTGSTASLTDSTASLMDSTTSLPSSIASSTSWTTKQSTPSHTGAIAGGVVGGVILLILGCIVGWITMKKRREKRENAVSAPPPPPAPAPAPSPPPSPGDQAQRNQRVQSDEDKTGR